MSCLLCLESISNPGGLIQIFSSESIVLKIKHIIETHFWLQVNESDNKFNSICCECWDYLESFHKFYIRIQKAHEQFTNDGTIESIYVGDNDKNIVEAFKISLDKVVDENEELKTIDPILTVKKRRGRPKKLKPEIESIQVSFEEIKEEIGAGSADFVDISTIKTDLNDYCVESVNDAIDNNDCSADNLDGFKSESESSSAELTKKGNSKKRKVTNTRSWSKQISLSKEHDEFIAANYKLSCCICKCSLEDFLDLKKHFRSQHNTRGYVFCCGKKLPKKGLLVDHINFHRDPSYFKCTRCDKNLADRRSLELHQKNHDLPRERIFQCEVCSKSFYRKVVFARHILLHAPAEEKNVSCTHCEKTFVNNYLMNQHLKQVHLNLYAKICDICGKSIRGKDALQRHQAEHEGKQNRGIPCNLCGVIIKSKYGLTHHMKFRHTEENLRPQECSVCGKISPNMYAHKRHLQYMHTMQRKHTCQYCHKAFKRINDLREHVTTHTGEVLYTCPHCPKTFNSNANMHSHRKKVHRIEWEELRLQRNSAKKVVATENIVSSDLEIKPEL